MKTAKAAPGTIIRHPFGGKSHTFDFGDDGTRQVSAEEEAALANYTARGGPVKVEVVEQKKGGK